MTMMPILMMITATTITMTMTMTPDLVLDLLHAGGLHDLLENGSLDRPQLSVSHRLQVSLSSVSPVLTILIILISSMIAIVIMIMISTLTLMLAVRLQL